MSTPIPPDAGLIFSSGSPNYTLNLTFNECHIIIENISRIRDKDAFLQRLSALVTHTTDPCLSRDLHSICEKIQRLSNDEFQRLRQDADESNLLFPPNYQLPMGL